MGRNRHTGNTIASRGGAGGTGINNDIGSSAGVVGGGTNENVEMSQRIEDRIEESRIVNVLVPSRTRGTVENLQVQFIPGTPGQVSVTSQSGNTYMVDTEQDTCTCADHRFRGSRCRHIEGVALAQEQIAQGTTVGSATDAEINVIETLREHVSQETADETHYAAQQFLDDEHFYSDNPQEFQSDLQRLKNAPIPYQYENALNGSDISFGIELEFVDGDSNAIARELYTLGICSSPRMQSYHSHGMPGMWKLERDGSVTDGDRGGELVSPILRDTPETWRQIETICEVAKRHGARVNMETGGHVHISADPLDGKRQRWRRLFKAFKGTEEALFRFAGGELGRFRNTGYTRSSSSEMSGAIRARLPEEGTMDDFRAALSSRQSGIAWQKYRSINLVPFTGGVRDAIEIRAFNGSLTPGVIQANVKVAAGLIHTAERSSIRGSEFQATTPSSRKRGELINEFRNSSRDEATMIRFVDTYFTRKSDKEHILSVMAKNEWNR